MAVLEAVRAPTPVLELKSSAIKVIVGSELSAQTFCVHENLICASSEFFKRAMIGEWLESTAKCVKLPDDDPDTFALYLNWLYTSKIPVPPAVATEKVGVLKEVVEEYTSLCRFHVLSEKLQDVKAKNASVKALYEGIQIRRNDGSHYLPNARQVNIVYMGTPSSSKMRAMFRDGFASKAEEKWFEEGSEYNKEFLLEVLARMCRARPKPDNDFYTADTTKYDEKIGE